MRFRFLLSETIIWHSRNNTEQVREITKSTAPCTKRGRRLAAKRSFSTAKSKAPRLGRPFCCLAAAAVVIAAAVVVVVVAADTVVAAATEQDEQDNDPAAVTTKETIVIHRNTSRKFFAAEPLIPWYSTAGKMCSERK